MLVVVAMRNIIRNVRRSMITLITAMIGAAALFLFQGFNTGILSQYRENAVHARFGYGQVNTKGYRDKIMEKPWEHWMKNSDDLLLQIKKLTGVSQVFPRVEFFSLLTNGSLTVSGRGVGIDGKEEEPFFTTMNIVDGKALGDATDGIVLGVGLARSLAVKPGDTVTVLTNTVHGSMNGADLIVRGVFHAGTRDIDDVIFQLPISQAQFLLDTQDVETVSLGLTSHEVWRAFQREFERTFPQLEATPFNVLDKVYYQHAVDWLGSQFEVIRLIILSVVVLGIFATASSAILERTQEIGMLRANGESVRDILTLLAYEGAIVAFAGGMFGLLLVTFANFTVFSNGIPMPPSPGITRSFNVFLELNANGALSAFLMVAVTSTLGTIFAGLKVARMPIAKALRHAA
jgi:putative ABC transport system permease protein